MTNICMIEAISKCKVIHGEINGNAVEAKSREAPYEQHAQRANELTEDNFLDDENAMEE